VRKNKKGKGRIFKEIAEALPETGELKPYGGVKEDRVTSKFNDLVALHAKKAQQQHTEAPQTGRPNRFEFQG
jgi:hypothetical protein